MQQHNTLNYEQPTSSYNAENHNVPLVQKLKSAINLAQTMPPSKIRKNLIGLINLSPEIEDHLMQKINSPLCIPVSYQEIQQSDADRPFLRTQFNRDGDSYRSNITNQYYPKTEGYIPSPQFRKVQELGNILFNEYTKLYYGNNALGNFYLSQSQNKNIFSCGYFAKKQYDNSGQQNFKGNWDSFNIAHVSINGSEATINVTTTILIEMQVKDNKNGHIDLTGFFKQSKVQKIKLGKQYLDDVVVAFGQIVEEMQTIMRQRIQVIYVGKTKEIIFSTRLQNTVQYQNQRKSLAEGLKSIHLKG